MGNSTNYSFTFIVLAYNHEQYINEHLESIRFLVLKYGKRLHIELIITDDCSIDDTTKRISNWLSVNRHLFAKVTFLQNTSNLGTCRTLLNALERLQTKVCKITAGDDVYSYENIFENTQDTHFSYMISGRTLYLYDGKVKKRISSTLFEVATDCVYRNKPLIDRFIGYNFTNAPNIFYPTQLLNDMRTKEFLKKFKVIEDYPLQLACAKYFPDTQFKLRNKVYVYYRRTSGSTYLVRSDQFNSDLKKAYNFLLENVVHGLQRVKVRNRLILSEVRPRLLKKFLNLETYLFIYQSVINLRSIYQQLRFSIVEIDQHQKHYDQIKKEAEQYDG